MGKRHTTSKLEAASPQFPMDDVSWLQAMLFCSRLSVMEDRIYRLPTEGEWEYACRAGTNTPFHFGDRLLARNANYGSGELSTKPVASYPANAFGLFDMHGNAAEWCFDWFQADFYRRSPLRDPVGRPPNGDFRSVRSGSFVDPESNCRSSARLAKDVGRAGFRVLAKTGRIDSSQHFEAARLRNEAGIGSVDCRIGASQLTPHHSFDVSQSWTVSLEFNAEKLESDFQCLFMWGDTRPGRDVICIHLRRATVNCWICDCHDNAAQYLGIDLPAGSEKRWIPVRLEYDRSNSTLRFFVDGKLVAFDESLIVPQLDKPAPAWLGNIDSNAGELRKFVGQVRNFSMANIATTPPPDARTETLTIDITEAISKPVATAIQPPPP